MIERSLRIAGIAAAVVVALSFSFFVGDQLAAGSEAQRALAVGEDASLPEPDAATGQPRRAIDGVARALLSPFTAAAVGDTDWSQRGLPTALALFFYGFCLLFLARAATGLP